MNNLPFTQNNNFNSNPLQQNQNFGGGYSNQYNPPPPSVTFSIIEGRVAAYLRPDKDDTREKRLIERRLCYGDLITD